MTGLPVVEKTTLLMGAEAEIVKDNSSDTSGVTPVPADTWEVEAS